jgi:hypothetical protein
MNVNEILKKAGWEIECISPFEIRHSESGSFATGLAAYAVAENLMTEMKLKKLTAKLVSFPMMHVCKHYAALEVVNTMIMMGYQISDNLAKALVDADDDLALKELGEKSS